MQLELMFPNPHPHLRRWDMRTSGAQAPGLGPVPGHRKVSGPHALGLFTAAPVPQVVTHTFPQSVSR